MKPFWIILISVCMGEMKRDDVLEQRFNSEESCMIVRYQVLKKISENPSLWEKFSCREVKCLEAK